MFATTVFGQLLNPKDGTERNAGSGHLHMGAKINCAEVELVVTRGYRMRFLRAG